jgi:hypothetical protein
LLTGGILAGQSLIRASEIRAVSTEYGRWATATNAFRDKYFAFPGDMANATAVWGKDNAACGSHSGTATTPGTCNGDGDTMIENGAATTGATGEMFRYWQQLALAGFIEGTYTGGNTGDSDTATIGTNVPASKMGNAGWTMLYGLITPGTQFLNMNYNSNNFWFGATYTNEPTSNPALRPEEAWNIDTKIDDGKPGAGKVIAGRWSTCTNATANTDLATDYRLTSTNIGCMLLFVNVF